MEKQKFEEEWRDAFDQAEASPSDNLWTNIELNLEKSDTGKMKRRLLFYKLTAAASILFAMCVAGTGLYYYNQKDLTTAIALNKQMTNTNENAEHVNTDQQEAEATATASINNTEDNVSNTEKNVSKTEDKADDKTEKKPRKKTQPNESLSPGKQVYAASMSTDRGDKTVLNKYVALNKNQEDLSNKLPAPSVDNAMPGTLDKRYVNSISQSDQSQVVIQREPPVQRRLNERKLPPLAAPVKSKLTFVEQDPVAVMMAKLERRELELGGPGKQEDQKKPSSSGERLWTSVGFAAGTFNTVNQNTPQAAMASSFASSNVTTNQSKASGNSYSVGMNLGTKLSARWVLQGGVNYLAQNSSYEANSVVGSADFMSYQAASINSLSSKNTQSQGSKLVATVPYSVDNSVRFLSVPVQAGYMMVNHALGLQINGGVSTDVFLQNKLSPQSSSLPTVTQGSGEDSPYRTINFSGLLGTEISYRFSKHYRLALNPGIRYPFNSIYKPEVGIKATPVTFDVGMRFRYIFH